MNRRGALLPLFFSLGAILLPPLLHPTIGSDWMLYGNPEEHSPSAEAKERPAGEGRRGDRELRNEEEAARERERILARENELARRIRSLYGQQRTEYSKALESYREEQRLLKEQAERERIRREDPDRHTFWQREQEQALGREIILTIPDDHRGFLYENPRPLQFQGWRALHGRENPALSGGVPLSPDQADITNLLLARKGYYVILVIGPGRTRADITRGEYLLPTLEVDGEIYDCINIYSDGRDILRLEMEKRRTDSGAGSYHIWTIRKLHVEYQ